MNENLRNRILDDLSGAYAQDTINLDEFERRVQLVTAAKDDLELVRLNSSFFPSTAYSNSNFQAASNSSNSFGPQINSGLAPAKRDCIAIFSGSAMVGEFDAPERIDAVAIFGGVDIDLRRARIPSSGIQISTAAMFGGITIRLPRGVIPEVRGAGVFGGFTKIEAQPGATGPRIIIHGAAIFGGVDIKY